MQDVEEFVRSRSWYQSIQFTEHVRSKGCEWCGEPAWGNMIKFLPENLEGMRVLDLGCNAGLFCVNSCIMGAKEVIGIDYTGWRPNQNWKEQQVFVKEFFEKKYEMKFNITYLSGRMEDILKEQDLGYFDYVYGIASLYYTSDSDGLVKRISEINDKAIIRLRDENRIEKFVTLFLNNGYSIKRVIREKWWEKLGKQTDDFYMYLFVK